MDARFRASHSRKTHREVRRGRPRPSAAAGSASRSRRTRRRRRCTGSCSCPRPRARLARSRSASACSDAAHDRGARRDQRDLRAEQPLQQRADERVVRATEDHGVDAGRAQRRAVAARELDVGLGDRGAGLADLGELRARDARQPHERVGGEHGALVGAAGDGRGRRQHADAPVVRARDGEVGLRADDADHVDAMAARGDMQRQVVDRARRRRVARDDDELDARARAGCRRSAARTCAARRRCGRRRESAPSLRRRGSPPAAARRAARAGRSGRRRRSRRRRSGRWAAGGSRPGIVADPAAGTVRLEAGGLLAGFDAECCTQPRGACHPADARSSRDDTPRTYFLSPTLEIVSLSVLATSCAMPPPLSPPAAATTPVSSVASSSISPTYSTVPWPV